MAMVESAFLTSLSADQKKARQKKQRREELLDKMESGDQILELHNKLQDLAADLEDRVENKLCNNETAFFLAYEHHMHNVQKEFKELRQRADEEETKTRRDAKIRSLERELDWFMNEALRLDELCKKYKKELDKWKGRADALEDDRQFLENQIQTAKKNNKTLRNAVENAQTAAYSALVAPDEGGPAALPAAPESPAFGSAPEHPAIDTMQLHGGLSHELEQRYQTCVQRLQQQLETERKLAAKMRAVSDRHFAEPSELEQFFLDCVEKVKSGIVERKAVSKDQSARLKKGDRGVEKAKALEAKQQAESAQNARGGRVAAPAAPTASLEDFNVADRRKVVDLLLSSEQVLQFLYDKLFPTGDHGSSSHLGGEF